MRFDGEIIVGVTGGALDRMVLGWAAEEAVARHAGLLVCHVRQGPEPTAARSGEPESAESAEFLVREVAGVAHTWFPGLTVTTRMRLAAR